MKYNEFPIQFIYTPFSRTYLEVTRETTRNHADVCVWAGLTKY